MIILLLVSGTGGCGSGAGHSLSDLAPPDIDTQIPTQYEQLKASSPQRPDWIDVVPEDKDGIHYVVGLSEHHASERQAREDAMNHARQQYAKYTGVDVSMVDKVIRTLHGASSEVFDPTVTAISKETQTTEARVSRIKAKEWYWVRFRATKRGKFRGNAYKYWVLVTVPADEYERVQELKKKWAAEKTMAKNKLEEQANQAINQSLKQYNENLAAINHKISSGRVIPALNIIQQEQKRLAGEIALFNNKGPAFAEKTSILQEALINLNGRIGALRSTLYIDTGRLNTIYIPPNAGETNCSVWVWSKNAKSIAPVGGMPLLFTDPANRPLARSTSDPNGKADFHLRKLFPGQYLIAVDTEAPALSLLDKPISDSLGGVESQIYASYAKTDLQNGADSAVKKLFSGPALRPLPAKIITVGSVTYSDSMQGSGFALALQELFRRSLTDIDGLTVVAHKERNANTVAQAAKTRGIGLVAHPGPAPSIGSAAVQAVIDGAQAAVEATYTVHPNEVWINLSLKEAGTDILKAASSAIIDRRTIPRDLTLVPDIIGPVSYQAPVGGAIKLELTSRLGDGQTYMEGDKISYFVSMNRDAYLLLIYEDAGHNLIQILPNRYSGQGFYRAGKFIEVPGSQDRFEFIIEGPFGLERVLAFAASRPFPALRGKELQNGLVLINEKLDTVLRKVRAHGKKIGIAYGEKQTIITTVPKT